ncbi:hypothetical protein RIR_jg16634.t2 [Rhizophagus irregularis DAOM 181602=DAOM 197198]|nr:hypothetical protein RIR_jg16634.t2 [Rhizophagus irregularis DAOM 181602=DAOM 197198]
MINTTTTITTTTTTITKKTMETTTTETEIEEAMDITIEINRETNISHHHSTRLIETNPMSPNSYFVG